MSNSHYKKFHLPNYGDDAVIDVDGKMTITINRCDVGFAIDVFDACDNILSSVTVWDDDLLEVKNG